MSYDTKPPVVNVAANWRVLLVLLGLLEMALALNLMIFAGSNINFVLEHYGLEYDAQVYDSTSSQLPRTETMRPWTVILMCSITFIVVPLELYFEHAMPGKYHPVINIVFDTTMGAAWPVVVVMTNERQRFFFIPSTVEGGLFLLNIIIRALAWYFSKRRQKPSSKSTQMRESQVKQRTHRTRDQDQNRRAKSDRQLTEVREVTGDPRPDEPPRFSVFNPCRHQYLATKSRSLATSFRKQPCSSEGQLFNTHPTSALAPSRQAIWQEGISSVDGLEEGQLGFDRPSEPSDLQGSMHPLGMNPWKGK